MVQRLMFWLLLPLVLFANWNDVAMSGFNVLCTSKGKDEQIYKASLLDLIDKTAVAIRQSALQGGGEFELKLPARLILIAQNSKDPYAKGNLKKIRSLATVQFLDAIEPVASELKRVIDQMSAQEAKMAMSSTEFLLSYLKQSSSAAIKDILTPIVHDLTADARFSAAFDSLMRDQKEKIDLNQYFTTGLMDEIYSALDALSFLK